MPNPLLLKTILFMRYSVLFMLSRPFMLVNVQKPL